MLGLHCCSGFFSSCSELGPLSRVTRRLLTVTASLVAAQAQSSWLLACRAQVQWRWHMGWAASLHVGSSQTRNYTCVFCIGRWTLYFWATKEALVIGFSVFNALQVQGSLQMKQQGVVSLKTVRDTVFLFFIYLLLFFFLSFFFSLVLFDLTRPPKIFRWGNTSFLVLLHSVYTAVPETKRKQKQERACCRIYLFFDRVFFRVFLKYFLEILFCPLFFSTECGNSGLVFKIMGCRDCNRIASE